MTESKYVKKAPRQSNLELSRILAMFLIVLHHFSVHGGVPIWSGSAPLTFNYYLDQLFSTGGKIGVNLFVLITGYFLAKKISKFSALVYLWLKTFSYVLVFFVLFCLLGLHPFSWKEFFSCFFPIRNDFYWFVSAYFLLILLSPFVTIGIKALGQKKLFAFLMVFGLVWSVVPTLTTKPEYYGSTLFWFVYLFAWGAFLRDYLYEKSFSQTKCLGVCFASWGFIALLTLWADWNNRAGTFLGYVDWFTFANLTSAFSLICALSLFCFFKQLKMAYRPIINTAAATMFGVYLIHENPIVYPWLWSKVFNVPAHLANPWFFLYALSATALVFLVCVAIDFVWEKALRFIMNKWITPRLLPIDQKIAAFFSAPPAVQK